MPRFFLENIIGDKTVITGPDATHISKSLRMKVGDEITLCDMKGTDYFSVIEKIDENVYCRVMSSERSKTEPDIRVTLYQALPKSDKLELIIQKAVELGVSEIVPVLTSRCISRPDEKSMDKKLERFSKISLEAAKQSGRGIIPCVLPTVSFKEAIDRMKSDDLAIICYEGGGKRLSHLKLPERKTISLIIGAEGGFSEEEIEFSKKSGIEIVGLGPRILRCETAPLAAISIIMNLTENM